MTPDPPQGDEMLEQRQTAIHLLISLRVTAGFRQADLAQRAQVSKSMVSQVEQGERHPSRHLLGRIAKALNLDDETTSRLYAVFGYITTTDTPTRIAAFLRADKRLSTDQADLLSTLLRDAYEKAVTQSETDASN